MDVMILNGGIILKTLFVCVLCMHICMYARSEKTHNEYLSFIHDNTNFFCSLAIVRVLLTLHEFGVIQSYTYVLVRCACVCGYVCTQKCCRSTLHRHTHIPEHLSTRTMHDTIFCDATQFSGKLLFWEKPAKPTPGNRNLPGLPVAFAVRRQRVIADKQSHRLEHAQRPFFGLFK